MKRASRQILSAVLTVVILAVAGRATAQFSGSIGIGGESTNNVQNLDTTAPDQLLMPAFQLNYDWRISGVSKLTFTGAYTPNFYSVNPAFSFNETMVGATGVFYLTNQDAIAEEAQAKNGDVGFMSRTSHFSQAGTTDLAPLVTFPISLTFQPIVKTSHKNNNDADKNDSLVDIAVSALYTLSGELDSTDIATKGISKARVSELEDLRDSISDVLSSIADVLDSVGYSESVAEIVTAELQHLKPRLAALMPLTKPFHTDSKLLDAAIAALNEAKPISDFLSTSATPSSSQAIPENDKKVLSQLAKVETSPLAGTVESETPSAPVLTLITSSERLRDFGYSDVFVHEDLDDSNATTLATSLTIPISYTSHTATSYTPTDSVLFGTSFGGNPNDTKTLAFSAALEGLTSTTFSVRGSYDYTRTVNPFDSVNTNTENRFRLISRFAPGKTTVLFGEASVGFRDYLDPLQVSIVTSVKTGKNKGRLDTTTTVVGSKFSQFSYGLGLGQFIGERWVIGGLAAFNRNPNLRAYVTTAQISQLGKTKAIRATVQVADDEYTYNLSRFTLFSVARIVADLDLGIDFSYEDRTYGSAAGPRGGVLQAGRTEAARFFNLSLSKLIPFEDRIGGIFNALMLDGKLETSSVTSSDPLYSYKASVFSLDATLMF